MLNWNLGPITRLPLEQLNENLGRLRLPRPVLEDRLRRSLEQDGQMTPLVVWPQGEGHEVIDGFKRLRAARQSARIPQLSVCPLLGEPAQVKAAILLLNRPGTGLSALEEGWVVQALVREEGKTQLQIAEIFSRHQSWVSRRLALVERLSESLQQDVRLGLLPPVSARRLASMPRGIQETLWEAIRQEGLSSREHEQLAYLVLRAPLERRQWVLSNPREALQQQRASDRLPGRDPRLTEPAANLSRQLQLLDLQAARLRNCLAQLDHSAPRPQERTILGQQAQSLEKNLSLLTEELRQFGELMARAPFREPSPCDTALEKNATISS